MSQYTQSTSVPEIRAKHPFPWKEQRMNNFVRMIDANGVEVILFEMTALCRLTTVAEEAKVPQQNKS